MSESRGRLIVLEGVDNVGKNTIVLFVNELKQAKLATVLAFPGNKPGLVGTEFMLCITIQRGNRFTG